MAYDFDTDYLKENTMPHADTLCRLLFNKIKKKNGIADEEILHWVQN